MNEFLELIKKKQKAEKLTDAEFAAKLEIDRVYWNNIKNGKRKVSDKVGKSIIRLYPDLIPDFLADNNQMFDSKGHLHNIYCHQAPTVCPRPLCIYDVVKPDMCLECPVILKRREQRREHGDNAIQ